MAANALRGLDAAGNLVVRIAALEMASRVIVWVDHVSGRGANGRIDFLGGNRDVVRVDRSLVVVRVAIVGVPMGALSLLRGLLLINS